MINSLAELRALYAQPAERALAKQLTHLEPHSQRFIELAPFLIIASAGKSGRMDASPRGGEPGFVKVLDGTTIAIPDSPGNNRLDTLENILETGQVGLIFLIPGVDETLRINGPARLSDDEALRQRCADARRTPKLVIEVTVSELYLHCAKALMRASLWDPARRVERTALPTMGRMIADQIGQAGPVETQEQMLERYRSTL